MSSEDGDVVDKVMVVWLSSGVSVSFVFVYCIQPLRPERSKEAATHTANSTVGRSLARFVHLSTPNTYLSTNSYGVLEHASRWSSSPRHHCLWTCPTSQRVVADAMPAEESSYTLSTYIGGETSLVGR